MVADVTETRNVIPSLEFKTCMTIKSSDLESISKSGETLIMMLDNFVSFVLSLFLSQRKQR